MYFMSSWVVLMHVSSSVHQGMDIKDVDLVIVYGTPSSVNQLHQVALILCIHAYKILTVLYL